MPKRSLTLNADLRRQLEEMALLIYPEKRSPTKVALEDAVRDWIEKNRKVQEANKRIILETVRRLCSGKEKSTSVKIVAKEARMPPAFVKTFFIELKGAGVLNWKAKRFTTMTKVTFVGEGIRAFEESKEKLSYSRFYDVFTEEYDSWLSENNPAGTIAQISAIRDKVCRRLGIAEELFERALLELHRRRIVWLSKGVSSEATGRPIINELGDKFYAVTVYEKSLPSDLVDRFL